MLETAQCLSHPERSCYKNRILHKFSLAAFFISLLSIGYFRLFVSLLKAQTCVIRVSTCILKLKMESLAISPPPSLTVSKTKPSERHFLKCFSCRLAVVPFKITINYISDLFFIKFVFVPMRNYFVLLLYINTLDV